MPTETLLNGKSQGGKIEYNEESGQKLNSYMKIKLSEIPLEGLQINQSISLEALNKRMEEAMVTKSGWNPVSA